MTDIKPIKVLAYSKPQMGHSSPVVNICAALAKRGHTVKFCGAACWKDRFEEQATKNGYVFNALDNGLTDEYVRSFGPSNPGWRECGTLDTPLLSNVVDEFKPDVLLVDFASIAGARVAKLKRVPVVLNCPGLITVACTLLPKLQNVVVRRLVKTFTPFPVEVADLLGKEIGPDMQRTITLMNSAWGLEKPIPVPPHMVMTGPVAPRGSSAKRLNKESHGELMKFLEEGSDKPVAYITTGSVLELQDEQVQKLFEGFNACDCYVVWSLKGSKHKLLPSPLPKKFYVNSWIPQIELLAEEQLKVVLTHCGFGGTVECMQFAKPVIGFPGFGDQADNAKLLEDQGCGLQVNPKKFQPADVQKAVEEILGNQQKYIDKCTFMQNSIMATKGSKLACETIEDVAAYGMKHLFPEPPLHLSASEETRCLG